MTESLSQTTLPPNTWVMNYKPSSDFNGQLGYIMRFDWGRALYVCRMFYPKHNRFATQFISASRLFPLSVIKNSFARELTQWNGEEITPLIRSTYLTALSKNANLQIEEVKAMTAKEPVKLEQHVFSQTDPEPAFYWNPFYTCRHKTLETLGMALDSGKRGVTIFISKNADGVRSDLRVTTEYVYSVKWLEAQLQSANSLRETGRMGVLFSDYLQAKATQKSGDLRYMVNDKKEWIEVKDHPVPPPEFHFHKGDLVAYSGPRECFKGMEGVIEQDHQNIAVVRWNLRHRLISKLPKGEVAIKKKAPVRRGKRQETHAWNCVRDIVLSS